MTSNQYFWVPKEEEKHFYCHKCSNELFFEVKMQRTDICPHCSAQLHCCKNCEYWDPSAHNQCKENISEYIPNRDETNRCTFFTFKNGKPEAQDLNKAKDKLESLFKKK